MKNTPLVSVILTTKNRETLLQRAINSILNQTYTNLEIIIINDASNDNTKKNLKKLKELDHRVVIINNKITLGSNPSRNIGIKRAKGKFIAGIDDDDEFIYNRIELLVKNYDNNFSFITSNNQLIFEDTTFCSNMPREVTLNQMLCENVIMNQGLIERSRIFDVNLYDEKLPSCQDYDLWIRLILQFGPVKIIQNVTQKIYLEESRERISTYSKSKIKGYFMFYKKYKYLMSEYHRKIQLDRLYTIKNKKKSNLIGYILSYNSFFKKLYWDKLYNERLEKENLIYNSQINLINNIHKLFKNKSDKYIIYGFGTIGKLIYNLYKEQIIGIYDNKLDLTKEVEKNKILSKEMLKINYPIIITPYKYNEEISKDLYNYNKNTVTIY